jgi:hypothetical protein
MRIAVSEDSYLRGLPRGTLSEYLECVVLLHLKELQAALYILRTNMRFDGAVKAIADCGLPAGQRHGTVMPYLSTTEQAAAQILWAETSRSGLSPEELVDAINKRSRDDTRA